jgi:hypothetical protein
VTRLTLTIPGRLSRDVADFAEASSVYAEARDLSGEGVSTFPIGFIDAAGQLIAEISYNGRVWTNGHCAKGEVVLSDILFDPAGKLPVAPASLDRAWMIADTTFHLRAEKLADSAVDRPELFGRVWRAVNEARVARGHGETLYGPFRNAFEAAQAAAR